MLNSPQSDYTDDSMLQLWQGRMSDACQSKVTIKLIMWLCPHHLETARLLVVPRFCLGNGCCCQLVTSCLKKCPTFFRAARHFLFSYTLASTYARDVSKEQARQQSGQASRDNTREPPPIHPKSTCNVCARHISLRPCFFTYNRYGASITLPPNRPST